MPPSVQQRSSFRLLRSPLQSWWLSPRADPISESSKRTGGRCSASPRRGFRGEILDGAFREVQSTHGCEAGGPVQSECQRSVGRGRGRAADFVALASASAYGFGHVELEEAARDGRLSRLPRFGKKTTEQILRGIGQLQRTTDQKLFHHARDEASAIAGLLENTDGISEVLIAGALRRRLELISELDFVVLINTNSSLVLDSVVASGLGETVSVRDEIATV